MAIQLSVAARNARLEAIETILGTAAKLQIWSGSMPANAGTVASGTKLAEISLASDWSTAASAGSKVLANLPLATTGLAGGTAGYFRLTRTDGTTCDLQGTITATGGGGDMTIDNTSIALNQPVNITGFQLNEPNA